MARTIHIIDPSRGDFADVVICPADRDPVLLDRDDCDYDPRVVQTEARHCLPEETLDRLASLRPGETIETDEGEVVTVGRVDLSRGSVHWWLP